MCEQEQIINLIVRHPFIIFSRYVYSERNHHHVNLLAVEHEAGSTHIMDEKAKGIYVSRMVQESLDRREAR
jgi:hypothetical protein